MPEQLLPQVMIVQEDTEQYHLVRLHDGAFVIIDKKDVQAFDVVTTSCLVDERFPPFSTFSLDQLQALREQRLQDYVDWKSKKKHARKGTPSSKKEKATKTTKRRSKKLVNSEMKSKLEARLKDLDPETRKRLMETLGNM